MPTLITIDCHEPMGRDQLARQPWSDVSVSFTAEPEGKICEFEPTLVARPALEQDISIKRELQREHPERDRTALELLEKIIELFDNGAESFIDSKSPEDRIPEIYTSRAYIDRAEAERMLVHFLRSLGVTDVCFEWVRPDLISHPG